MSGYCPDCGNTQCLCKEVAADEAGRKAHSLDRANRRPYRCTKCSKTTHVSAEDIWGKIIRCVHCAAILMDNRHTLPPNTEVRRGEIEKGTP
jgi:DNA-directed RNA polymerase subunit RPC12/RpoP